MKITWNGHSCFLVETADGSVVFDPYAPGSVPGFHMPQMMADLAICSHGHGDHNFAEGVCLTGKANSLQIRAVDSFHDDRQGSARGKNKITVLEAEGIRLAHLGDLGHELSEEQIAQIGKVDVLMVPVGGFYTIDRVQAKRVSESLQTTIIIPMHFRSGKRGYDVLTTREAFLSQYDEKEIRTLPANVVELTKPLTKQVLVFTVTGDFAE